MRLLPAPKITTNQFRQAFSLVELMVVTVIVVILAGLVAGVVVKAIDASRTTATLTTMEIIKSGLSKQLQEIGEQSRLMRSEKELLFASAISELQLNQAQTIIGCIKRVGNTYTTSFLSFTIRHFRINNDFPVPQNFLTIHLWQVNLLKL